MSILERADRVADVFRSSRRQIQISLWTIRALGIIVLGLMASTVFNATLPNVITIQNLQVFLLILFLIGFALLLALFTLVSSLLASVIGLIPLVEIPQETLTAELVFVTRSFVEVVLFSQLDISLTGLNKSEFLGTGTDPLSPLAYLLNKPQRELYNDAFVNGLLTFGFLMMIITGLNFLIRGNPTQAVSSFIFAQFVIGYGFMKERLITLVLTTDSIGSLFSSNMFSLAFTTYLFLEYALQTNYLSSIAKPNLERQTRVQKQVERLEQFKLGITGVDEPPKRPDEEEKPSETTSSELAAGGAGSTTAKKFGAEALLFLLDSAHDSVLSRPDGEKDRLTVRLQRYFDGLKRHDPRLLRKLGGTSGKTFNPIISLFYVVISSTIRLTLIVLLSWLIINPQIFFSSLNFSPTLINSLELEQPEGLLLVLIPLIFLIMGISLILIKLLNISRKSEELIIEEHQIEELIKKGKAVTSRKEFEELQTKEAASSSPNLPSAEKDGQSGSVSRKRRRRRTK